MAYQAKQIVSFCVFKGVIHALQHGNLYYFVTINNIMVYCIRKLVLMVMKLV